VDKAELMRFEAQAQIMKALSHPTRLFVAHQLGQGEKCVGELTEMVGADTSTVSKHLALLKGAGIVDTRRHGTTIYYSLKMKCVLNFFVCVNDVLKKKVESQLVFSE
jgi:DNA-binding transcriptional ArsR family regulator